MTKDYVIVVRICPAVTDVTDTSSRDILMATTMKMTRMMMTVTAQPGFCAGYVPKLLKSTMLITNQKF